LSSLENFIVGVTETAPASASAPRTLALLALGGIGLIRRRQRTA
jgi:MYXO-CTERM domain-containing protein